MGWPHDRFEYFRIFRLYISILLVFVMVNVRISELSLKVSNYIAMMAVFILDLTTRKLKKKSKKCKSGSNEKVCELFSFYFHIIHLNV